MKISVVLLLCITTAVLSPAQPLSGSYTVGGSAPDFISLQDAANALKSEGVDGPTFFNIRPGTYSRSGSDNTVLVLDSIVAGLSPSTRITFQPDAATGGTVDNVVLELNITVPLTTQTLVDVTINHVTFNQLTFLEHDSSDALSSSNLVQIQRGLAGALTIDGIVFDGCRFTGSNPFGTENAIELGQGIRDLTVRGTTFLRMLRGISGLSGTSVSDGTMTIEDNQFLSGWRSVSGSGNHLGAAMEIFGDVMFIRRNVIDFAGSHNGGYHGIFILVANGTPAISVEQNFLAGSVVQALTVQGTGAISDSLVIANNMINVTAFPTSNEAAAGINVSQNPRNVRILFNTIVMSGGGLIGLLVDSESSTILNNIIITTPSSGFNVCYQQSSITAIDFRSDYNDLYTTSEYLVISSAGFFVDLSSYQAATGLDTNSISKDLDFVDFTDLHLSDCQAQDPALKGIPVPGITVDIDDELRDANFPMIGADESNVRQLDMFADPFVAGLSGTGFSVAAGKLENILFDGLAVPDYDNDQVVLYRNFGGSRVFEQLAVLPVGFKPNVAKFFDLDRDFHPDLIVGGDTTALKVFWGDGLGNFPSDTTIGTVNGNPFFSGGRVRSLDTGRVSSLVDGATILITEDDGFVPTIGYLAYLDNSNGRHLEHRVTLRPGSPARPDSIPAVLTDFVVANFDESSDPEVAALSISPLPPSVFVFNDTNAQGGGGFLSYGARYEYHLGTGSSPGHAASVVSGDFDGDGDVDLVSLGSFTTCVFVRNLGNYEFVAESIAVAGAQCIVSMDYENDGDLDFVTLNEPLETNGFTVFLNNGSGSFVARENCFFPFARGRPFGATASDFDQDGMTDIAVVSSIDIGVDSLFVLYNLGGGTVHVRGDEGGDIPHSFVLGQNYPNPFNPATTITYGIPAAGHVTVRIYNILGQEVVTMIDQEQPAGKHALVWKGRNSSGASVGTGVYFYRIEWNGAGTRAVVSATRRMMLVK